MQLLELWVQPASFFKCNVICTWKNNWQTNYGYLDLDIWQTFSQKWMKSACHYNWQYLLPMLNFKLFKWKLELWKTCIWHHEYDSFPTLKNSSDKLVVILENVFFFLHWVMKCINIWKNLYISVNQCFSNGYISCISQWLQNHGWVKVQDKQMNTIVKEYKMFIDIISNFILQLTLVWFWYSIKKQYPWLYEKSTKVFFHFSNMYLCEATFPHIL